jgi:hypothetical protein
MGLPEAKKMKTLSKLTTEQLMALAEQKTGLKD